MGLAGPRGTAASSCRSDDRGYAMVLALVAIAVLGVWTSALLPTWRQQDAREKEAELAFRGEQYARAVTLYTRARRTPPPDVDALINFHYLRKKWKDPITGEDFVAVAGSNQPGVGGGGAPGSPGGNPGTGVGGGNNRAGGGPQSIGSSGSGPGNAGSSGSRGGLPPGTAGGTSGSGSPSPGGGGTGFTGVQSKSKAASYRIYNGASHYNEWVFMGPPAVVQGNGQQGGQGGPGGGGPGTRGGGGPQGGPGGRGGPQGGPGVGRGGPAPPPAGGGRGRGGV
jgi:type II secretory pathway pseudopilin PulG